MCVNTKNKHSNDGDDSIITTNSGDNYDNKIIDIEINDFVHNKSEVKDWLKITMSMSMMNIIMKKLMKIWS